MLRRHRTTSLGDLEPNRFVGAVLSKAVTLFKVVLSGTVIFSTALPSCAANECTGVDGVVMKLSSSEQEAF